MAKNTGSGSRTGSVTDRTQVKNPVTGDYVKRNERKEGQGRVHGRQAGRQQVQGCRDRAGRPAQDELTGPVMDTSTAPACPACGFRVFNRRYPKCESCGAELPESIVYTTWSGTPCWQPTRSASSNTTAMSARRRSRDLGASIDDAILTTVLKLTPDA